MSNLPIFLFVSFFFSFFFKYNNFRGIIQTFFRTNLHICRRVQVLLRGLEREYVFSILVILCTVFVIGGRISSSGGYCISLF